MRTKIFMTLLVTNIALALYSLGRFDGILAPAYQRTTYLNGMTHPISPAAATPATPSQPLTPKNTTSPTAAPAITAVAPSATSTPAHNATSTNPLPVASSNTSTSKPAVKGSTNATPTASTTTTSAPPQKTNIASNKTSKKTNNPTPRSTAAEEPVYEPPARIAPQPTVAQARTESASPAPSLQRHQVNKNIAAMCQNSAGAWLPCR